MSQETSSTGDAAAENLRADEQDHVLHRHPWELITVWVLWAVYGAFYFCRTNLSAAIPGMEQSVENGGLGLTGSQIGQIQGSGKISYGIGQLLNGQMAEHISPRRLLAFGMFGSAALNQLFGLSTAYYTLLFIWAANGYFQSLGWSPCIRVVGNWIPVQRRGKAIGIIGTGYQVTLGLTYLIAGYSAHFLGWRGALQVPSILLALTGIFMLVFLKDSPDETVHESSRERTKKSGGTWLVVMQTIGLTLTNPALWLLGISLGLLNACRYGFVDWGIAHLMKVQNTRVDKAALTYLVLALGAVAGSYLTGMVTDRFFGGRRAPAICCLLVLLSILTLLYERVAQTSEWATIVLLALIGFCIYGPQVLLVGTAPADLARRGTPAAAAGFVNFLGYMGAASGDWVTGYYKMEEHGGWKVAINIWAGWALAAAVFAAILWNAKPKKEDQAVP